MTMPPPVRPTVPQYLRDDEHTPAEGLRPFRLAESTRRAIAVDDRGRATVEALLRFSTSVNASQQKIWSNIGVIERKVDGTTRQIGDVMTAIGRMETSQKEALERQEAADRLRREGDAHLAGVVGSVMRGLAVNTSADAATREQVQQIQIISRTTAGEVAEIKSRPPAPLTVHARRQVLGLGGFGSLVSFVIAFKEPLLAYARTRGWIP